MESINRNINQQQEDCSNIIVDLGNGKYRCLICEKDEKYSFESEYIIHAEDYLQRYDIKNEE